MKLLDLIGPKPQMYINKQKSHKTAFGGILTIFLGILSVLFLSAFGMNLIERKAPSLSSSQQYSPSAYIERENLNYSLAVMMRGGVKIEELNRKLNVTVIYSKTNKYNKTNKNTLTTTTYQMVPCEGNSLFEKNINNIKENLISDSSMYWCLPENFQNGLYGKFGSSNFAIYNFVISPCQNSTQNNNSCYPEEQLKVELDMFFIHFLYNNYYLEFSDFTNPFRQIWGSQLLQCSYNSFRTDALTHRVVNLDTDSGWILSDKKEIVNYQFHSIFSLVQAKSAERVWDLKTDIFNLTDHYSRAYLKLQEVLANTGGFIKFVMIVFSFVNDFFSENELFENHLKKIISKNNSFFNISTRSSTEVIETKVNIATTSNKMTILNNFMSEDNNKIKRISSSHPNTSKNVCTYQPTSSFSKIFSNCKKKKSSRQIFFKNFKDIIKSQLNLFKVAKLIRKFKLTEKIIFGQEGKNYKNILNYIQILTQINKCNNKNIPDLITIDGLKDFEISENCFIEKNAKRKLLKEFDKVIEI